MSKLLQRQILRDIKNPNMKVSATRVIIVNIEQLKQVIFRYMLTQFIMVPATLVINVITWQHRKVA